MTFTLWDWAISTFIGPFLQCTKMKMCHIVCDDWWFSFHSQKICQMYLSNLTTSLLHFEVGQYLLLLGPFYNVQKWRCSTITQRQYWLWHKKNPTSLSWILKGDTHRNNFKVYSLSWDTLVKFEWRVSSKTEEAWNSHEATTYSYQIDQNHRPLVNTKGKMNTPLVSSYFVSCVPIYFALNYNSWFLHMQ